MTASRAVLFALLASALLPGCTTGARRQSRGGDSSGGSPAANAPASDTEVVLTDQDLARMDQWVKRRRWILGDDVTITASREYFGPIVSIAERIGVVERQDSDVGGDGMSVLTYVGRKDSLDTDAPRVMVGTGITVMARHRLTLRLAKTRDTGLPVRIQINAQGKASTGSGDVVSQRADALTMNARIYRAPDGAYAFDGN